tara:strand:+ start:226 stop:468 length:243 start_codon:yes stop_codon:yes gene_type:complete
MKYKKTIRPLQRDYSSKPADPLDNQPDQSEEVGNDLARSVGGWRQHRSRGLTRWEKPTWKDKLKNLSLKFKMKKRKKKKN